MLFNSFSFVTFLILVFLTYYILPHKFRWILLLIASYIFYAAWNPAFIVLIIFSTVVNYFIAIKIYNLNDCDKNKDINKKRLLILSLILNFGLLFIFKYLTFVNRTFIYIFEKLHISYNIPDFDILLPIGISFFTFQAVGYIVDVYRKRYVPEFNFFKFALFISFFPQLIAGPIERASNLLPQLSANKKFSIDNFTTGIKFMIYGFFKKVVIADRIGILVNTVYNAPLNYEGNGLAFIIATILFSFQIYCDFSGYSDIARGSAKILGIDLMQNFKAPFFSRSSKEFWTRWHISLSSWFKDYLYIPLGGSKVPKVRMYFNVFITFLVSGLWHGADWTFVIWGALNGILQIVSGIFIKAKSNFFIVKFVQIVSTFLLISATRIFFRANSIDDALYISSHLFDGLSTLTINSFFDLINNLGLSLFEICISIALIILLLIIDYYINFVKRQLPNIFIFLGYLFLAILIFCLGVFYNAGQFIYLQF